MIFLTTGSRSFQFNRLLKAVDEAIGMGLIEDSVFAQIGSSDYKIKNYKYVDFLEHDEFNKYLDQSDTIITHGGTGIIVNAAKKGKRIIAVPRLKKYNEVVDEHQIQLIKAFEKQGIVTPCYECTPQKIANSVKIAKEKTILPYKSNAQNIINSIETMIERSYGENNGSSCIKKDKIRVLMCGSERNEKGGMNSVIDQLMNHDWASNITLSYCATHISGNLIKKILFFSKAYLNINKELKEDSFDIIHMHMSYKGSFYRKYYIAKKCKKYNKKVIIHLHGSEFKDFYRNGNGMLKNKIKQLFTFVDKTIVLGTDWQQFILEIAPNAHIEIINNAIYIPKLGKKSESDIPNLLFLGALIKRKGVIDLLKSLAELNKENINSYILNIAGSGDEESNLKEYVNENNLTNNVKFLGWINSDKKRNILESTDIFVLPSYNEGLPIAILEALSYGIPVISTNVGSISEAVLDNKNGYLFEPGDIMALKNSLKNLILNSNIRKELAKNARKIALDNFSEDIFFEKIRRIYITL